MSQTTREPVEPQADPCVLTQRQIQESTINHLAALKAKIFHPQYYQLGRISIDDDELASLGIRKMSALDVDETAPFDPEPLFFRPCPVDEGEDFPALVHGSLRHDRTQVVSKYNTSAWKPECQLEEQKCSPDGINKVFGHHSLDRVQWFMAALQFVESGILEERSPWKYSL